MKIHPLQKQAFNGYANGKIKALYMQNPNFESQINIFNQMKEIGEKENFDVFMHGNQEIFNDKFETIAKTKNPWSTWAQDNKFLLKKDNKTIVLIPEFYRTEEKLEAKDFCAQTNFKGYFTELLLEGGNVFLGKKEDGENFFLSSMMGIYNCGQYLYLKDKLKNKADHPTMLQYFHTGTYYDKENNLIASQKEYDKNWEKWVKKAINIIQEDFNVKKENMTFIPDADFHIDMVIRPLEYPYILVNDDKEIDAFIKKMEKKFRFNFSERNELKKFKNNLKKHRKKYNQSNKICEKLQAKGFVPIKIAGSFGRNPVNFINAIVQKNDNNDLIYITNSTKPSTKLYETMQDYFEQDLKEKYPDIKKIYFVDGGINDNKSTNMMYYLSNGNGGIHCLCCEEIE